MMPILRSAINYYSSICGWQYVTLSGSLTSRVADDNIFFSASMRVAHLYGLSLIAIQTSFFRSILFGKLLWIAHSPLIVITRSHIKIRVINWYKIRREKRCFRLRKTFIDRAKTFDTLAWTPFPTRRFVSFEWIMARNLFLIVHRLMHLTLSPVAVKFYLPFLEHKSCLHTHSSCETLILSCYWQLNDIFLKSKMTQMRLTQVW